MNDMLTVIMQNSKPTCIGDVDVQNSVVVVAIVDESVVPCKRLASNVANQKTIVA